MRKLNKNKTIWLNKKKQRISFLSRVQCSIVVIKLYISIRFFVSGDSDWLLVQFGISTSTFGLVRQFLNRKNKRLNQR